MSDESPQGDEALDGDATPEEERVPGDWQDVKRYLIGLVSLILVAVVMMFAVAVYEYWHYAGAKAEDTTPIPASADPMRQGAVPERLRKVHGMEQSATSAASSARTPPPAKSAP